MRKIPVTIITGFLGAGKTTLVHHLISNADRRLAIIVNEFGEMGMDGTILKGDGCGCDEENILELSNGCLCCTVQEEFLPTMLSLMERKDTIDHIIIETSGLALPKPLVKAFQWPDLKTHITVDAVVTLVDCVGQATGVICDREKVQQQRLADENLDHEVAIEELFEDQLSCADLIVMSKADLVSEAAYERIAKMIKSQISNDVKMIRSVQGNVAPSVLLGVGAAAEQTIDQKHSHHEVHHANGEDHHHHDDHINSMVVPVTAAHQPESLVDALKAMVEQFEIYRIKGVIDVPSKPMRMILQGVGGRFEYYYDRKWQPAEKRGTQMVVIGADLACDELTSFINNHLSSQ